MKLRPFNINDAETILSWCKDKHAFRLWSADRYKDFPAKPEEMMEQYEGDNMYPLTAVVGETIVGHILLRFPSEDKIAEVQPIFAFMQRCAAHLGYRTQRYRRADWCYGLWSFVRMRPASPRG